ncbi:MAG TPA: PhoPQ-activated protein PqaA family protein [Pseudomonadota bacterium]|nr:PhoPQ-activated protein PqaA family protein [Pseudomonadota bacterium]
MMNTDRKRSSYLGILTLGVFCALAWFGSGCQSEQPPVEPSVQEDLTTDLDKYVKTKEPTYSWKLRSTVKGTGYTAYLIDLKSLTWRSSQEVDKTQWQHELQIVKPDNLTEGPALLAISGGDNGKTPPTKPDDDMVQIAKGTQSIVVNLEQIPNQPLLFAKHDGKPHTEDGIVAFSWVQAMKTHDPTWNVRFPMVKSSVLAMDAVQEFLRSSEGGNVNIEKFIVAGASKRGWTTWLVAAVDPRVVAAIPIVIDVLNVEKFMVQHVETYGFWAKALYDYDYNHVMQFIGTPEMTELMRNEDPYLYRKRLSLPKFVLNSTGDQFFLPDGSQNYYADLPGDKYLRYVPNADHSLSGSDAMESVLAYVMSVREQRSRPTFAWNMEGADQIRVQTETKPQKVVLWQATNTKSRDFRVETIGKTWKNSDLTDAGGGVYVAKVAAPATGYTAFFIELTYPSGQLVPYKFSTQVRVVPDKRLFAGIDPKTAKYEGTGP